MSAQDHATSLEPTLRPVLGISERLLAVAHVGAAEAGDPAVLLGDDRCAAALSPAAGRHPVGASGGVARRLVDRITSFAYPQLAVTDQRLLVCTTEDVAQRDAGWQRWFGPAQLLARQVHTVPREAVLGAGQEPGVRQRRGRLVIGFIDGSACALACAPSGLAEKLVRALGG